MLQDQLHSSIQRMHFAGSRSCVRTFLDFTSDNSGLASTERVTAQKELAFSGSVPWILTLSPSFNPSPSESGVRGSVP